MLKAKKIDVHLFLKEVKVQILIYKYYGKNCSKFCTKVQSEMNPQLICQTLDSMLNLLTFQASLNANC